jgi:hypothetical protein
MNAVEEEISDQERCIKQSALTVVKIVKFLSNQKKASQSIAETATKNTENINY